MAVHFRLQGLRRHANELAYAAEDLGTALLDEIRHNVPLASDINGSST